MRPNKRDELVREAMRIFDRDGYHGTGMDRLVTETGISKTTMFKHFRTKDDLVLAVLRYRDETFRDWMNRQLHRIAETPRDRLIAVFDLIGQWFGEETFNGCMFIKAAAEFPEPDDPIAAQAREHKRLLARSLEDLATGASAADPAGLSRKLMLVLEGAIVSAHMGYNPGAAEDAKAAARILIADALSDHEPG